MRRDKILGLILMGLSVIVALGLGLVLLWKRSLPLVMLAGPAVVFLLGLFFFFTDLLERSLGIRDEIEELPKLVADDIQALRARRLTWTHIMVAVTIVAAIVLLVFLIWYKKWEASWGPVNILLISAVMVAIALVVGLRSRWFQHRQGRSRYLLFLIPVAGLMLTAGLGLYFTEPREFGGRTRSTGYASEGDRWAASRASGWDILGTTDDDDEEVDVSCEGEECLVMYLIMLVIVCVAASMFIPHYWVVAAHLLLTIMALIAVRELLVSERGESA
jgi:hypothetical protein